MRPPPFRHAAGLGLVLLTLAFSSPGPGAMPSAPAEPAPPTPAASAAPEVPDDGIAGALYDRWDNFTRAEGLPSDKVLCVRVQGDDVWAGTDKGLARFRDGRWERLAVSDDLPLPVVLSLDFSPHTGDLWIGTMGGLARLSAGRLDVFTQSTSGLSNDFVNDVECDPDDPHVWAATAMGASRLDLATGTWTVFTEENAPMREPWTYSVDVDGDRVFVGAWGAGILEMDKPTGRWREYHDPDEEMEIDLLRDDGPVHDVTSGVDAASGLLWQSTYFGVARYDGRRWRSFFKEDSGLASNFVSFVRARGRTAWLATDDGVSATDGDSWVTYRRLGNGRGERILHREGRVARAVTPTGPVDNHVFGVDFGDDAVWLATAGGISRGRREERGAGRRTPHGAAASRVGAGPTKGGR